MPTLLDYLRVSWILNLSPSLQHSLLKKWKQLPFFHKVAKKGKSSIFGQERFPLCECFSDYRNFASMLVMFMVEAGIKWCLRVGGWRGSWLKKFSSHPLLEIFRFQFSSGLHFRKPSTYSSWQKMIWSPALLYQKIGTQHIFSIPMLEILPIHPCGSHLC